MSSLPPQPAYILRGHAAQIHSIAFIRSNTRLITGDAEGWMVIWNTAIRRPVAVWRAHVDGAILGLSAWGRDRAITHGKDNKLIVWKFSEEDEVSMSTVLPVGTPSEPRRQPWVLHILDVNTMNFCSFAQTSIPSTSEEDVSLDELLIAVPNTMSSETVDIFHLPTCKRLYTVPNPPGLQGGMVMALSIFYHPKTKDLILIAGYESGHTVVSHRNNSNNTWQSLYTSRAHTQPILSLEVSPSKEFYLTSSADANIVKYPVPSSPPEEVMRRLDDLPLQTLKTGHSGQQSLKIRNDGKVFATAGWDGRVRVYGTKNMTELAVLKWHKEGCYAVAFAEVKGGKGANKEEEEEGEMGKEMVRREGKLSVREERIRKAEKGHWLAVGSKDCKVSLWDIY